MSDSERKGPGNDLSLPPRRKIDPTKVDYDWVRRCLAKPGSIQFEGTVRR